jgi:uncharacterized DUF497 family protein
MEFAYDPDKDAANFRKHGIPLSNGVLLDLNLAAVSADERRPYGEPRFRAFGRIDGKGYCLVFTMREGAIRMISFRRAREKEMRRYGR